jgi:hypothetical protein
LIINIALGSWILILERGQSENIESSWRQRGTLLIHAKLPIW